MTPQERRREQAKGEAFWKKLMEHEKWNLGDQLVLGEVDYLYWFGKRPSSVFLNALDNERLHWESTRNYEDNPISGSGMLIIGALTVGLAYLFFKKPVVTAAADLKGAAELAKLQNYAAKAAQRSESCKQKYGPSGTEPDSTQLKKCLQTVTAGL